MALRQAARILAGMPLTEPDRAGSVTCVTGEFVVPAGGLPALDVVEMAGLPAYCTLVDLVLYLEDMDSATAAVFDVGPISGRYGDPDNARNSNNAFIQASTVGQTGGIVRLTKVPTSFAGLTSAIGVGFKLTTAAGTPIVGAKIRMALFYMADPGYMT